MKVIDPAKVTVSIVTFPACACGGPKCWKRQDVRALRYEIDSPLAVVFASQESNKIDRVSHGVFRGFCTFFCN